MVLYKYHGAGNDFLLADIREHSSAGHFDRLNDPCLSFSGSGIRKLCDRHTGIGADGLMLLADGTDGADFDMHYYNSDGSTGMFCGNGGRCITAFAADLGITPGHDGQYLFNAPDGAHTAMLTEDAGSMKTIRLSMKDVSEIQDFGDGSFFMDTGTRHLVVFVPDVMAADAVSEGRTLRYDPRFAPAGTNVNFVQMTGDGIIVRTYEKGVEDETLACGTGIVASAIASVAKNALHKRGDCCVKVRARIATLAVSFRLEADGSFRNVSLTGPAQYVAKIEVLPEQSS